MRFGSLQRRMPRALVLAAATGMIFGPPFGCSNNPPPRARQVQAPVVRDIPSVLRGTVGTEASLLKAEPVIVSGYGLVVGLKGTGGGDLPPQISATMERELGLMGISRDADALRGTPLQGMTPQQVLRSRDVAVVVVFAAIMPGAPMGTPFDVYVTSVNKSPEISLEGGTLWTTELRVGPPSTIGGHQTRHLASARGPIFINPFAEPGSSDGVGRHNGRVLGGGGVTQPLELELILDNESHSRARAITQSINNRFPPGPGESPTARGRGSAGPNSSYQVITVAVPAGYRDRTDEFLNTLLRVQINDVIPQEYARQYVEALKSDPYLANDLTWCLVALPQRASVPFLRDMYEWPEVAPRRAALRAGALLNDAVVTPHLISMASSGSATDRVEAIDLLSRLSGARVEQAIRDQLGARELSVRVAAYEALADRAERLHVRRLQQQQQHLPINVRVAHDRQRLGRDAQMEFQSIHGVKRKAVDGKFLLDIVPIGEPLIYVAQQGRPRIVIFGENLELTRPILVSAWSDRLILTADSHESKHRMLYLEPSRIDQYGETIPGTMLSGTVSSELPTLIEYIAHRPTPEDPRPGFGMTYSEVVGVLHAFWGGGAIKSGFAVQDDLLQNRLLQAAQQTGPEERPETAEQAESIRVFEPTIAPDLVEPEAMPIPVRQRQMVVPLEPPPSRER